MKRYFAIAAGLALVGGAGAFIASCGDTCGAGTHLVNSECVADTADLAVIGSDGGGGAVCGTNTMLAGGTCDVSAAVCGPGTKLDTVAKICKIPKDYGTLVGQSTTYRTWSHYSYNDPAPPDGGTSYPPVGSRLAITAPVTDATLLFMAGKLPTALAPDPLGKLLIPTHWFAQVGITPSDTPTAIDHQITVGEWKTCSVNYAWYKNPPSGKKFYKLVADATGCPPDLTFSVWNFYSTTAFIADRVLGTTAGGLPNHFNINGDGTGHFEREMDPNIWFKSNAPLNGASHIAGMGNKVPDLTAFAGAHLYLDFAFHNNTQSNGNSGFCETDGTTNCAGGPCCVTPPSRNLFLPGQFPIDVSNAFIGARIAGDDALPAGTPQTTPIPLSMLQPY